MKKLAFLALISAIFALTYVSSKTPAQIQNKNSELDRKEAEVELWKDLQKKAEINGFVDIIISLKTKHKLDQQILPTNEIWKRELSYYQDNVLKKLQRHQVQRVEKFEIFPFISMRVDSSTLMALKDLEEIKDIQENKFIEASLLESNLIIGTTTAHNTGFSGQGQTIAIIDSGVDKNHSFLINKVISEACYSTNDPTQNISSLCPNGVTESTAIDSGLNCHMSVSGCEHGTHVAGIAAGRDPANLLYGVAKNATLIAIKAASLRQQQNKTTYNSADVIKGLQRVYALSSIYNISSVNISLGGSQYNSSSVCDAENGVYKDAIDSLRLAKIATVIASGNDGYSTALSAPACISSAISVGSTDDGSNGTITDNISSFSDSASFLSLLAPGQSITSSIPGGGFSDLAGTSMAAPQVAGAWAILKQKTRDASVSEILGVLRNSGLPILDIRNNVAVPRIRVDLALQNLGPTIYNPKFYIWTESPQFLYSTEETQITYKIKASKTLRRQIINFSVANLANNITATFSDQSISCSLKSSCEINLTINIPRNTTPGNYSLTVTGKGPLGTSSIPIIVRASLLLQAVLFYDPSSPNINFREPIVDGQGNLIVVSNHLAGSCTPSTCGSRLNSIAPDGKLNWQTPSTGFIFPINTRYWSPVLASNNTIYLPAPDSVLHSFNSNGTPVGGFPIALAPSGTLNWQFPSTSPVLVDSNTGLIYVSVRQTVSFDNFPNRIAALDPKGVEQWRVDYPNHARSSCCDLVQSQQGDIYTFLATNSSARFTRLNKNTGNIVCDSATSFGSARLGGDEQGVFTDSGTTELYKFGSGCGSELIYNTPGSFTEFRKYNQGILYAVNYPPNPNPNEIVLLAVSSTGQHLWTSQDIIPNAAIQPIRTVKNNIAYILGLDRSDFNKTKLFAVNSQTGLILSRLDTSTICGINCGVAVSEDGRVYLTNGEKIYKVTGN